MTSIYLKDLLQNFIKINSDQNVLISGVTQDSRKVSPGNLFFAISGLHNDGRHFIPQVIANGAAAILYDTGDDFRAPSEWSGYTIPLIGYPELNNIISSIAADFYQNPSRKMTLIGVTGTNGKTTISQMIAQALAAKGHKCAVVGTMGEGFLPELEPTGYTTPDPINLQKYLAECLEQGADSVSMEVSSHSLSQNRVSGVEFDIGIFSNLTRDHLDYHKTMKAYGAAKAKLFLFSSLKICIYNVDDEFGRELLKNHPSSAQCIAYSIDPQTNLAISLVHAKSIQPVAHGFNVQLQTPWGQGTFHLPLLGRFNVSNALAVIAVLGALNTPFSECLALAEQFQPVDGRMQVFKKTGFPLVIVDYAHNPDALKQVLVNLRQHHHRELWCVFGCGGNRDRGKRSQMGAIAAKFSDHIILTNDTPRDESPERIIEEILEGIPKGTSLQIIKNRSTAIRQAIIQAVPGDIVLIAGRGHESEETISGQTFPLSDIDTVNAILNLSN
jgi:UDP-N-acetylmuramoyl-L-alanyl-D-glutamate--2,6-diaminopimelate ligase